MSEYGSITFSRIQPKNRQATSGSILSGRSLAASMRGRVNGFARTGPQRAAGLGERFYERIRDAIITCEIAPAAEISESLLSKRYRVGKASVRYALSRLGQEGWVRSVPRQGHWVAELTIGDVEEVFAMRELLEPQVARLAATQIDPAFLQRLHSDCALNVDKADGNAARTLVLAHQRFHLGIAYAAGHRRLFEIVERLQDESLRLLYFVIRLEGTSPGWNKGQQELVDALIAGNGERAAKIALSGIQRSRRRTLQFLNKHPELLQQYGVA